MISIVVDGSWVNKEIQNKQNIQPLKLHNHQMSIPAYIQDSPPGVRESVLDILSCGLYGKHSIVSEYPKIYRKSVLHMLNSMA